MPIDPKQAAGQLRGSLYEPCFEHDSCGIGMIVDIAGRRSHQLVLDAISILEALTHRGGVGYEPDTGDGAGILLQMPDAFMRRVADLEGIKLPPEPSSYGVAMLFASPDDDRLQKSLNSFANIIRAEKLELLGIREVPVSSGCIGPTAAAVRPSIRQVFIGKPPQTDAEDEDVAAFERQLYIVAQQARRHIRMVEHGADPYFYLSSCSAQTIVYKGMLLPNQLAGFYLDLQDKQLASAIALVHSRFSTNTFPSWERAHPMHHLVHNGEINTIQGNVNWVKARQAHMRSTAFGEDLAKVFPVISADGSDSAMLDDFLNLLLHSGYSLPEAVMLAIPEPWEENRQMDRRVRAMYEYNSCLVEPWDGPASVAFSDGRFAGATLDRNGLRPSRYYLTRDKRLILASEVGVLPIAPDQILRKDRLRPGRMLLIDTQEGRIIEDEELKLNAAKTRPYQRWLKQHRLHLKDLVREKARKEGIEEAGGGVDWRELSRSDARDQRPALSAPQEDALRFYQDFLPAEYTSTSRELESAELSRLQTACGYSWEIMNLILRQAAENRQDPIFSMGYDAPLAVLSNRPQLLFSYFKQRFAQVTNPPIDAIREHLITSSIIHLGAEANILQPSAKNCRIISHNSPVLDSQEMATLRGLTQEGLTAISLPILFDPNRAGGLEESLDHLLNAAEAALDAAYTIIILSDRGIDAAHAPVPSLLAVSALHHHLVRIGRRTSASIVIESAETHEVHHFALLVGYGADAVHPYLACASVARLAAQGLVEKSPRQARQNYLQAMAAGVIKVMSKMGISTVRSYHGAQIFEALGLDEGLIERHFCGTVSRIGGADIEDIEAEYVSRHREAFAGRLAAGRPLASGGELRWRNGGEFHLINPQTVFYLQQAVRQNSYELFKKFSAHINDRSQQFNNLRALLDITTAEKPIPLKTVEPATSIVKRFKTGAMSYGSISQEAHECMAIAMNRLGGRSNSGEGGEISERYLPTTDGLDRCSQIKQVASGRFGVTIDYLTHCTEIQIKMAQGAKPGEGGHLPGPKVYPWVAQARFSTPGVELISPPPHHDIYSIEDLAQLIFDLKNANRAASVNVKLVSEAGVGTIAVGVAKGLADKIVISGYDGGTGAAAMTSIRHAGLPWELGLAESHQSLVANRLRDRVVLETDGKLFNGRDVVIAALLGAEEFTFATAPLLALGCDMMRVCNLDTCPVGIATQNPQLRAKFCGRPEHIENLMLFIAQEVREWMARIGTRCFDDLVGHVELLQQIQLTQGTKASKVNLSRMLKMHRLEPESSRWHFSRPQDHKLDKEYDLRVLLPLCEKAISGREQVEATLEVRNRNRSVATLLSSEITRAHGAAGLPENSINLHLQGCGGQSFGAFLAPGVCLDLQGDCNDYLAKGMSGGRIIVRPPQGCGFAAEDNIIIGNVAFYGATGGEAYISGLGGERFCVRNSGAIAVIEGVGDHACEYMTGGRVLVLGSTGRNFAAGMSGGIAYIWDADGNFAAHVSCEADVLLTPLTDADRAFVLEQLQRHHRFTQSQRAALLLADVDHFLAQVIRLVPADYQRVLEAIEEASRQGLTPDESRLFAYDAVVGGQRRGA
ncbi:MAG: glutamate synthase large subunit [Coriobacteriales bacterium]|nr:glutamate synthase large subunit [Coriobacteriales bacterium]